MMLNPGQLNSNQGSHGAWANWSQPAGFGPVPAAYGNAGQGFAPQPFGTQGYAGFAAAGPGASALEDIADDIAERIANEIADQAATGAAALFQAQVPQAGGQSLGGLNVKRWLNAARVTDTVHDSIKQGAQQLCRQVLGHLLNVLQAQWSGAGQHGGQQQATPFGGLAAPGLAAYGAGPHGGQPNVAQLAPVIAAILGMLQTQGQGFGQGPFGQGPFGQGPFGQGPFGQGPFGQGQYGVPGR